MKPQYLLTALVLSASALAVTLVSYSNARFNYWVHVPSDLTALPPPDNGDGQAWRSQDGRVRVAAWGSYGPGVLDIPKPSAFLAWSEKNEREGGNRITYRKLLKEAFVLSGYLKDGRIFYQKTLVKDGTAATVRIEYPLNQHAVWDGRAVQIASSLKWGQR